MPGTGGAVFETAALASVLSQKAAAGEIILVDSFGLTAPKTAAAKAVLEQIARAASAETLLAKKANAALIALPAYDASAIKSFANLGNIATEEVRNVNPVAVLAAKYLIIESPAEAFAQLATRLA